MKDVVKGGLRRAVYFFGTKLESVINSFNRVKKGVGAKGGLQPILSLESQLSDVKIRELISFSLSGLLDRNFPQLKDKVTLEIADGGITYSPDFVRAGSKTSVFCDIGGTHPKPIDISSGYLVEGTAENLPFKPGTFDFFIANLATPSQGDVLKGIEELSRIMSVGAQGILFDFHPYSMFANKGELRMRSLKSSIKGVEDYYRVSSRCGLRLVNLRELFIDERSRSIFAPDYLTVYRNAKGSPFIIVLYFYKPKGRG